MKTPVVGSRALRPDRITVQGLTDSKWGTRHAAGFSLVQLMVANTLTLMLLGFLATSGGALVAAVRIAEAEIDQRLRLRQVSRFLEHAIAMARMPVEWSEFSHSGSPSLTSLSDVCMPPEHAGAQRAWGGVAIVDLASSPCLGGDAGGFGLYIEMISPCPGKCDLQKGYVLMPVDCAEGQVAGAAGLLWVATWQESLSDPGGCAQDFGWARLDRMVLSHRRSHDPRSESTMRLQKLLRQVGYGWAPAETLVSGIEGWELTSATLGGSDFPSTTVSQGVLQLAITASASATIKGARPLALTRLILQ